jgi:tRNA nucleotidyltransferase (CCA-adding enzyme)
LKPAFRRKKSVIAAAFRRRPVLAALARLARERRLDAWIVGGAPRDALLGRPELDVDVAVSRDAEGLARRLAADGFGTAVAISERFPRVYRVAGRRPVDLVELEGGSIERDLGRRDFTANAIAIDLLTGAWMDPFGGAADLDRGRLRLVGESNLVEDPLRAFRAARFFATHGLRPDAATRRACARVAPRLEGVAPERIQAEMAKMLEAARAAEAFRWAGSTGLLAPALGLVGAPAGRWRAAGRNLARLETASRRSLPPERRRILRLAAIAAGLGLSGGDASAWLRRRRHGRADAAAVARLLDLERAAARLNDGRERWAWVHDAGPALSDALALLQATRPNLRPTARRLTRLASLGRRGPAVSGTDLMQWLGESPGPRVGSLLREVAIEGLRGAVRTRRQARQWLLATAGPAAKTGSSVRSS